LSGTLRLPRLLDRQRNPLPEGTFSVGAGLIVAGVAAYGFLAISARALGPDRYAPLSVLWVLMFVAGPGFFLPLEQEVGRALASRRAQGIGGGPLIRRACLAGGALATLLVASAGLAREPLLEHLFDDKSLLLVGFTLGLVGYFAEHLTRGTLSGHGRFRPYAELIGSEAVLRLMACALLAMVGVHTAGPYGLVLGIAPFAAVALALRSERDLIGPGPDAPWSELSSALGYLLAASVAAQLLVNAGPLAVKLLASEGEQAAAGRFLNGLVIARIPLFMFQAVQAALLPKLAGLAGAGRHQDFRHGLRRLMVVVFSIGALGTAGAFAVGPWVVRILFGPGFELTRSDLGYLAAGSAAIMVALALAQALIALSAYPRVVIGWLLGILAFLVVVSADASLLPRVERAFLAGSAVSAVVMGFLLLTTMSRATTHTAEELVEASQQVYVEP
jgi:O-antigen/teichoic acid export membrane protein